MVQRKRKERVQTPAERFLSLISFRDWEAVESFLLENKDFPIKEHYTKLVSEIFNHLVLNSHKSPQAQKRLESIKNIVKNYFSLPQQTDLLRKFSDKNNYYMNLLVEPKAPIFLNIWIDKFIWTLNTKRYSNVWSYLEQKKWSDSWQNLLNQFIQTPDFFDIWQTETRNRPMIKELGKTSWLQVYEACKNIWLTQNINFKITESKTLLGLALSANKWSASKILIEAGSSLTQCGCEIKIKNIISGKTVPKVDPNYTYQGEQEKLDWVVHHIKGQYEKTKMLDHITPTQQIKKTSIL